METKICKSCKIEKNIENYRFIRHNKNGTKLYKARCEECYNMHYKEKYRKKTTKERSEIYKRRIQGLSFEDRKKIRLKYRFGLSLDEYNDRIKIQNNKCFLCEKIFEGTGAYKSANVDHDHKTGKIRKLLCSRCNQVLGLVDENLKLLKEMILYLEIHNDKI
jgi:hypothetical protein